MLQVFVPESADNFRLAIGHQDVSLDANARGYVSQVVNAFLKDEGVYALPAPGLDALLLLRPGAVHWYAHSLKGASLLEPEVLHRALWLGSGYVIQPADNQNRVAFGPGAKALMDGDKEAVLVLLGEVGLLFRKAVLDRLTASGLSPEQTLEMLRHWGAFPRGESGA